MQYIEKIIRDNDFSVKELERKVFGGGFKIRNLLHRHSVSIDTLEKLKSYFVKLGILNYNFDIGYFLEDV